jgi:hypothetical protein
MIGKTKVHGRQLLGLRSLRFELATPRPTALTLTVRRDPSQDPNALLFDVTTHGNGTETKFDGSFELLDAAGSVTHVIEFQDGSAQAYSTLVAADPNKTAVEEVVIVSPKFTVRAGGAVAEFEARETTRHVVGK